MAISSSCRAGPKRLASRMRGQATIEEVNDRQLEKLTEDNDFVAVAWFTKACK